MRGISFVRVAVILLTGVLTLFSRKNKRNKSYKEELSYFESDEDGLYPWEIDTDDSPERITKNVKKFVEKERVRRGKW